MQSLNFFNIFLFIFFKIIFILLLILYLLLNFILLINILKVLTLFLPLLIAVAIFTYVERKILGFMQRRKGPNTVGFFGILQPIADGFKLLLKETLIPINTNKFLFILAPILAFFLSLINWLIIPFTFFNVLVNLNLGIFYLFIISTLSVYSIICAGWSSNSKYPLLGALRAAAQMISYEVSFGIVILIIIISVSSLNLRNIILFQTNIWFILPFFPFFLMFFISILAETNRPPFDLPEAEAELVSGYNVEYSSMTFACFFLAEYANMILISCLTIILFFGGWLFIFNSELFHLIITAIKTSCFIFLFVWVRAAFPRLRYDQLMFLGWKVFLPVSLGLLILFCSFFFINII